MTDEQEILSTIFSVFFHRSLRQSLRPPLTDLANILPRRPIGYIFKRIVNLVDVWVGDALVELQKTQNSFL